MNPPTPRQVEVLWAIAKLSKRGMPPTLRELGQLLRIRSTNCTAGHLRALTKRGLVSSIRRSPRSLVIMPAGRRLLEREARS